MRTCRKYIKRTNALRVKYPANANSNSTFQPYTENSINIRSIDAKFNYLSCSLYITVTNSASAVFTSTGSASLTNAFTSATIAATAAVHY